MAFPLLLLALILNQAPVSTGSGVETYMMKVKSSCLQADICVPSLSMSCDPANLKCVLKQDSVCVFYVAKHCIDGGYCGEVRKGEDPVTVEGTCQEEDYCIQLLGSCDNSKVPKCVALYGIQCAFRVSNGCSVTPACDGAASTITAPSTTLALLVIIALCCFFN